MVPDRPKQSGPLVLSTMNNEQNTPKPPVGELVLSLQFEQLTKLNSGHFGRIWSDVFPEFRCDPDAEPIDDQFEDLGGPMKLIRGFAIGPDLATDFARFNELDLCATGEARDRITQSTIRF
jgi:hypothetical protein